MLVDSQKFDNTLTTANAGQENDEDIQIIVEDIVEKIVQISQQNKQTIENNPVINLVDEDEIIDVEGEWENDTKVHSIIESILGSESDQIVESVLELEDDYATRSIVKCENYRTDSPSNNWKVSQRQSTLPEYFFVQNSTTAHDSKDTIQKVPVDSKTGILESVNITDKCLMSAKVVIERLPSILVRPDIPIKIKGFKPNTISKSKVHPLYSCSDCCYKTSKKKNMGLHLDDTSHSSVIHKKQVISNGDFYSKKFNNINDSCKIESKIHYGLRQRYSTKWFSCAFNGCDFSANSWRLMYNHVKFAHLQMWKSRNYRNKQRNVIKDTPKVVNEDKKLFMKTLVIVKRLPTHIITSKISKPVNQLLLPHAKIEKVRKSSFGNDPVYCNTTDYENISEDGILYREENPLFFQDIRDTELIPPTPDREDDTTVKGDLRLGEKMDDDFSLKFPDESEDASTVSSFKINAEEGQFCGFDDLALLGQSDEAWQQQVVNAFALANSSGEKKLKFEADKVRQHETVDFSAFSDPTDGYSDNTSDQPVDPALLPIAKVVLRRLPDHLFYCKSIKMTKDCATLHVSNDSPDFVINFCRTCKRMNADRKKLFIPKECFICRSPLLYMCTKCHDNYYVDYDSMVYHWLACKNANLADVKINPISLVHQLENANKNVKKEPQLSPAVIKSSGKAVLRLLTAKVVVDKLPESVVKSKRIIKNEDFIVSTQIKSEDLFKRYCPKCKTTTMDCNTNHLKICEKCSSLLQYMCTNCNNCYFFNYFNLKEHRRFCKPMDQWDDFSVVFYRCLVCDFKTEREFSMVSHLETTQHSRDGTMQTAEAFDKSTFVHEQHAIGISKKTKRYCPNCRILAPSARNKDRCRKCNTRLFYHCIKCGEKKASRRVMRQHLWTRCHSSRYQCVLCDYTSNTWNMMQKHLNRRHISNQFHCDGCTFRAERKQDLQRHVIKGHLKVEPIVKIDTNDFDSDVSQSWRDF